MKAMISLFALACASVAFAGTEISHNDIANAQDFYKGEASNFQIVSLTLGKDAVETTTITDDACAATAEDPIMDCTSSKSVTADVVHVGIKFNSDSPRYEDGANSVELSIATSEFTAAELAQIKKRSFAKATLALVKLSITEVKDEISTPDYNNAPAGCGEDLNSCSAEQISYTSAEVTKLRVAVTR